MGGHTARGNTWQCVECNTVLINTRTDRKSWRKNHPYGFFARPSKDKDGNLNLAVWECGVPGAPKTDWEGGLYKLEITFPDSMFLILTFVLAFVFLCTDIYLFFFLQTTQQSRPSVSPTPVKNHPHSLRLTFSRPGKFNPPLFHPNVYPSGTVCLSILNENEGSGGWRPGLTIPEILLGIQTLLNEPNPNSPAQTEAYNLFRKDKGAYSKKIKEIAKAYDASLQL